MRPILVVTVIIAGLFHSLSWAFLGAFWLGVDAKVETSVKIDQQALDTINNLPLEARKQAVAAANEIFSRLDQAVKDNSKVLGAEIERTSLQAAIQWECTGKSVVDKLFSEFRSVMPRWTIFSDKCEKRYAPDKVGPGPGEKVKIAACWIYDALPETASPDVISTKMVTLQLMSADAACRLRETPAATELWKESSEYGLRYVTWIELKPLCNTPNACNALQQQSLRKLLATADTRDIGEARERLTQSTEIIKSLGCSLECFERSLVQLYLANQEIRRNRSVRESEAVSIAKKALASLVAAKTAASLAKAGAASFATVREFDEQSKVAQATIRDAADAATSARLTSSVVEKELTIVDAGVQEVTATLAEVSRIAAATISKEEKRRVAAEAAAEAAALRKAQQQFGRGRNGI